MYETYASGSYDIKPSITTNMDWKGATLSKFPYYANNLINPPANVLKQVQNLQKYQPKLDGTTDSTYVATGMNVPSNIDNPNNRAGINMPANIDKSIDLTVPVDLNNYDNRERFTMMNPYINNK